MFVIFCLGPTKSVTKIDYKTSHCFHCNNSTNWIKRKETLWFSLFFIPIFPVNNSYSHICSICNSGNKITKQEFERN